MSVAPVATAIAAFIGYTEKGEPLTPTLIESLLDFEELFGLAPAQMTMTVNIDDTVPSISATVRAPSPNILYDALRLFFANGGDSAYIVSAGSYGPPALTELRTALDVLMYVDEPTLIVIPEAQTLDTDAFQQLTNAMLAQCKTPARPFRRHRCPRRSDIEATEAGRNDQGLP